MERGVLRSTDRGEHWTQVNVGLTKNPQGAAAGEGTLIINPSTPSTLYVVAHGESTGRVFCSTDWGDHWQLASTGLPDQPILALAIDPSSPTTLYASASPGAATATDGMCVFRTDDAGGHWRSVSPTGFIQPTISLLAIDPLMPTTVYAAGVKTGPTWGDRQSLFLRSTDRGEHWQDYGFGQVTSIAFDPVTAGTSYIAASGNWSAKYLWRLRQGGITKELPTPPGIYSLAVDPLAPTTIYVGSDSPAPGVFRSLDSGEHWSAFSTGLADPEGHTSHVECIAVDPMTPSVLYAATWGSGLFRYDPWPLTTVAVPAGAGSIKRTPELGSYAEDASVTLEAVARPGWHFTGWSGDVAGSANPITVVMHSSKAITANFVMNTPRTLVVSVAGSGAVSRSPDQPTYGDGSVVTLTATPLAGWYFQGWYGDVTGSSTSATVRIDGDKRVTATFALGVYSVTTSATGSGYVSKTPNQPTYPLGTSVTLAATPSPGYSFAGWSGDLAGTANPAVVVTDGNRNIVANFAKTVFCALDVGLSGKGSVTRNPDAAAYVQGSSVTLTAVPAAGYTFAGWSGDLSGASNPASITVDTAKTVTAHFSQTSTFALVVAVMGSGVVSKSPDLAAYPRGTTVWLTATPSAGYSFSGWSGDLVGTTNPARIDIDGVKYVAATFSQKEAYLLKIDIVGEGSVDRFPDLSSYDPGTSVTLTASPSSGYGFVGWTGDLSGNTNPEHLVMDNAKDVTARFARLTGTVTPTADAGGNISPSTVQAVADGGRATFIVTPDAGYHISEVLIDGRSQRLGTEYGLENVIGSHTIHASFAANTYTLTIVSASHGEIARSPSLVGYRYGAMVTLTATPAAGYRLAGWIGATASAGNSLSATVLMDANKTVSATFQAIPGPPPAVTLLSPSNGSSISGSMATLSWKASSGATSYKLSLAKSSGFASATTWTISGTSRTASALSPGTTYYWRVAAINTRGTSPWSPVFHFTTKKPEVTLTLTLRLGSSQMLVSDGKGTSDSWTLDAAPLLGTGSRTLVPIRAVAEAMGGTVEWNSSAKAATVVLSGNTLVLTLGRNTARLNGESMRIDTDSRVVPTVINGRTMLPLRFVAESLGAEVSYDAATKTIVITRPIG